MFRLSDLLRTSAAIGTLAVSAAYAQTSCLQEWGPMNEGMIGTVLELREADLGGGPSLFAGGTFQTADLQPANRIARWDGTAWHAMGLGLSGGNGEVFAIAAAKVGGSLSLYAGGTFMQSGGTSVSRIARWTGTSWVPLGNGLNGPVRALAEFDDGTGPALFAAGDFTGEVGGGPALTRIAKWNGASWLPLGSGLNDNAYALAVYDDGFGPDLYAAGAFGTAGGSSASRIARWDGHAWSPLGSGLSGGIARCLAVHDDGGGAKLFVGGGFSKAGGAAANRLASWSGSQWSALGSGANDAVYALASYDDGVAKRLVAGGNFSKVDGVTVSRVAGWNGAIWAPMGQGTTAGVRALGTFSDVLAPGVTPRPAIAVGGLFDGAGGDICNRVARWPECIPSVGKIQGCFGNQSDLSTDAVIAKLGTQMTLELSPGQVTSGVAQLYAGLDGLLVSTCGLLGPGVGELFLALSPVPVVLDEQPLQGGPVSLVFAIPSTPPLAGEVVLLQALSIDLVGTPTLEASTGMLLVFEL